MASYSNNSRHLLFCHIKEICTLSLKKKNIPWEVVFLLGKSVHSNVLRNVLQSYISTMNQKIYSKIFHACLAILRLASCPWGPVTANWMGLLTEMYVIYMERSKNQAHRPSGYSRSECYLRKES